MNTYEVFVNGTHFLIRFNGTRKKMGFYTKMYVEADNAQDAELKVIEMLRERENLRELVLNKKHDPPMMYAEEIIQIMNYHEIEPKTQGLVWYEEE